MPNRISVLLLGESAGLRQWSGGALVIAGIILIGSGAGSGGRKAGEAGNAEKAGAIKRLSLLRKFETVFSDYSHWMEATLLCK